MDHLRAMRAFLRVLDRGSFTAASLDMGLAPGAASQIVKDLEAHLGATLLIRSTRSLRPTEDGLRYAARARRILSDISELEHDIGAEGRSVRGLLRIQLPAGLSRLWAGPVIADFARQYPDLRIEVVTGSGAPDFLGQRLDAAIFIGTLPERDVIRRSLGRVPLPNCASPAYVAARGAPKTPDDLADHDCIGVLSGLTGASLLWDFRHDGRDIERRIDTRLTFDASDTAVSAALAGAGVLQMIHYLVAEHLDAGTLVPVMKDWTFPGPEVSLVTPRLTRKPRRIAVFEAHVIQAMRRYRRLWQGEEVGDSRTE